MWFDYENTGTNLPSGNLKLEARGLKNGNGKKKHRQKWRQSMRGMYYESNKKITMWNIRRRDVVLEAWSLIMRVGRGKGSRMSYFRRQGRSDKFGQVRSDWTFVQYHMPIRLPLWWTLIILTSQLQVCQHCNRSGQLFLLPPPSPLSLASLAGCVET